MPMAGKIHQGVSEPWLATGTDRRRAVDCFLEAGFSLSWARLTRSHNTDIGCCFLEPNDDLKRTYGFEYQIFLAFHHYNRLEPRAFQAISNIMNSDPAKGRVEPLTFFFVSRAPDVQQWTTRYLLENRDERLAIPIQLEELATGPADGWKVKNAIQRHYLSLDLFKNTLPLQDDTFFFGRHVELTRLLESAKRSENVGLFGLRKTGKTSLLLKLQRFVERERSCTTVFLNAELATVRKRRWHELLEYAATELSRKLSLPAPAPFREIDASDQFTDVLLAAASKGTRLLLMVDEVEWITPELTSDPHWAQDFMAFWQTLRGVQSQHRSLSIVVAGVNPYPVEQDLVAGKPNPLFGIVTPIFLRGFSKQETAEMVTSIGKVSGLRFSDDAVSYLFGQYGGHPLLTRLACSFTFEQHKASGANLPLQVNDGGLRKQAAARDRELRFYCRHVVSELEKFYPKEYALLELLACGDIPAFRQGARREQGAPHLLQYGIVRSADTPYVEIDVVRDFVAEESARRVGRESPREVVPLSERGQFLKVRLSHICEDVRTLEGLIRANKGPALFGPNSFPMADRLLRIEAPGDAAILGTALTALHLAFVESIDNFGKSHGVNDYFWSVVKKSYPALHDALHRIRIYRHNAQHLSLTEAADAALRRFLERDLPGEMIHHEDRFWIVLQACLDELLTALQREVGTLRG